jgi:hypothetical protein
MNWKRGLIRLWFVVSACWIALFAANAYQYQKGGDLRALAVLAVAPVAFTYVLGAAAIWIVSRFRSANDQMKSGRLAPQIKDVEVRPDVWERIRESVRQGDEG